MRDPFAPVSVVSVTDPAVTFDSVAARDEYAHSRNPALFKPRDPGTPCVFTVQPCAAETAIRLDSAPSDVRALLSFRACVHRVALPNGEVLEAKLYESGGFGRLADEEWVSMVARRVGPRRVREIGEAAHRLSMLDDYDPLSQPPGQPPQS
jgi:hypothetical protein